ncbi:MAG: porin [Burkholderiaceae bacterium]|nr:porin [Burkholderiaceae bacterium]
MTKKLLTVAVVAALPAAAFAQSNVALYGVVDAGVGWNDSGASGSSSTGVVQSGYQAPSRFGFRGTEDLGGGLKAVFNLEAGFRVDTGVEDAAGFFQRRSVVGLAGGFGEVVLGRDYTAGYRSAALTDVMAYGLYGNWTSFHTGAGGITSRASNGIHYSGKFSGLTVRATWAEGEIPSPSSGGDVYGISADYVQGPLTLQGYYQEVNNANGDAVKQSGLGAGYRFGGLRVTVTYGLADNARAIESATNIEKTEGYGLGAGVKVGIGEVLAQVIQIRRSMVAGTDPKATVFGIAYLHPLSKRTNLYANFGMTRNNSAAAFPLWAASSNVTPGSAGDDPRGVALGIRHVF